MTDKVDTIYVGERNAMLAEVAAFDPVAEKCASPKQAKYLVMPYGEATFDTLWCSSRKEAAAIARDLANSTGAPIAWI